MNPNKPCRKGRRPTVHVLFLLVSSTSVAHASYLRHSSRQQRQLPGESLPKITGVKQPPTPTPQTNTAKNETLSSIASEISTIESELSALQSTDDALLTDDQFAAKMTEESSLEAQKTEAVEEELELMMEGAEDDETLEMLEAEEEELKEEQGEGEWDDLVGNDDLVEVLGEEGLEEELEEVTEEIAEIEAEDDDGANTLQKEAFEEELINIKNDIEEVILENEQLIDDDGYAVYSPNSNSSTAANSTGGMTVDGLSSVMLGGPDSIPANINIDPTLTMDLTQYNTPVGGTGTKEATSPVGNMESEVDRHGINETTPEVLESEAKGAAEEVKSVIKDDDDDYVPPPPKKVTAGQAKEKDDDYVPPSSAKNVTSIEANESAAEDITTLEIEAEEEEHGDWDDDVPPTVPPKKNSSKNPAVSGSKGNAALNSTASVASAEKIDKEIKDTEDDDKDISENEHVGNGTFSASSTTISQSESGTPITSETEEGLEEELEKVNEEIEDLETKDEDGLGAQQKEALEEELTNVKDEIEEEILEDEQLGNATTSALNATVPVNKLPGNKNATSNPKPKSPETKTDSTHKPPPPESTLSPTPGSTTESTSAATPAPVESLTSASPPTPEPTYRPTEGKVTDAPTPKPTYEYEEPTDDSLDPVVSEQNIIENEAFSNGEVLPPASGGGRDVDDFLREEEEEVKKVGGWMSFAALVLMIYTAYQMSENPDGFCASLCRLVITVVGCIVKILLIPFKYVLGGGRSSGGHYMATPSYRDPYGSRHMELT